jgi:cystathionine beta-lyase
MLFCLDDEIDRKGTNSVKWEFFVKREGIPQLEYSDRSFGPDRIIPMWVADMDFCTAEPIVHALVERAKHGIFGYSAPTQTFHESIADWMGKRQGWQIEADWICHSPGVVPALNMMVQTFTEQGDGVLIQPPVYHPFPMAIENNSRKVVANPLTLTQNGYRMDFMDLERRISDQNIKMAILCHPHNPVGRVWTREELQRFGEICLANDILVVSDEIHGDLIYSHVDFHPFATLGSDFEQHSITCTAPSKTFNLAGLHSSNIIIPNKKLREQFNLTLRNNGLTGLGTFGIVALEAAYSHGEGWLDEVMSYIEENYYYLEEYCREYLPEVRVIKPEGTYLVWLDCRALGLDNDDLEQLMLNEARVYLDEGYIFGEEGAGFERINIACPRSLLKEALERIRSAVHKLGLAQA